MNGLTSTDDFDPIELTIGLAERHGWLHEAHQRDAAVMLAGIKENAPISVRVTDDGEEVMLKAIAIVEVPGYAELEILRFLNYVNNHLGTGTVWWSKQHNCIAYTTTFDFSEDRPLTEEHLENRIRGMVEINARILECTLLMSGYALTAPTGTVGIDCLNPGISSVDAFEHFVAPRTGRA